MPIIQISKIQLRRGPQSDLPIPTLDQGELGFTIDTGRLFVGQLSPTNGMVNYNRVVFPYQNVEVLTENSPLAGILAPQMADNQHCYLRPTTLIVTNTFTTVQMLDSSGNPQDYHLEGLGGVNAYLWYYMFDANNHAVRHGRLTVLWNSTMATEPLCADEAETVGDPAAFTWTAKLIGSIGNQHVILQYINQSGSAIQAFFRADRPVL